MLNWINLSSYGRNQRISTRPRWNVDIVTGTNPVHRSLHIHVFYLGSVQVRLLWAILPPIALQRKALRIRPPKFLAVETANNTTRYSDRCAKSWAADAEDVQVRTAFVLELFGCRSTALPAVSLARARRRWFTGWRPTASASYSYVQPPAPQEVSRSRQRSRKRVMDDTYALGRDGVGAEWGMGFGCCVSGRG